MRLQPRRLTLVPKSRLRLRLPSEEVASYLALAGSTLDLDGSALAVGIPRVESLRLEASLVARLVTIGQLIELGPFEEIARRQLRSLGVSAELSFIPEADPARKAARPAASSGSRTGGSSATPSGSTG